MITISLCMIVKNEERILKRCLDSVRDLVDEIIIVDTGSTDATKRIAAGYTDKIYDFEWINDFSVNEILDAIEEAAKTYLKYDKEKLQKDSVELFISKISGKTN